MYYSALTLLSALGDVIKKEFGTLVEDLGKVGREIKDDLGQITLKHKDTLTDVLKRSKEHAVEAWNKVREN